MSVLSFVSRNRMRKLPPLVTKNNIPVVSVGSFCSDEFRCPIRISKCTTIVSISKKYYQYRRLKSSLASISNLFLAETMKDSVEESVKNSIVDKITKDDNKVWTSDSHETNDFNLKGHKGPNYLNGDCDHKNYYCYNNNSGSLVINGGVDDQISAWHHDPLDDLFLDKVTPRYLPNLPPGVRENADPFLLSKNDVYSLSKSIREDLLGTDHPVLNEAASYFFGDADGGKKVRPLMVMLLSRALADTMGNKTNSNSDDKYVNVSNRSKDVNNKYYSFGLDNTKTLFTQPLAWQRPDLPQAQRRLAEISEMIHTASLFHDDVIDGSETRRGKSAVHMVFGNKMAILAGDYLLARASISLARLRHVEVIECMSTIIEHLVRGEVMQMRGTASAEGSVNERMNYYLKKNYYKTGSLMANSCKSAAILAASSPELVIASYNYGKHVGMAFQLVDDVLDFEGDFKTMGKPALADLRAGLSTAPVLFAAEEYPELELLMDRKFKNEGDFERGRELVMISQGIQRTKELAQIHAERAMEAVLSWNGSEYRDALINLAYKVVQRTK